MQVVIDSSVLVALLVPNDVWHFQADALWNIIEASGHTGVYFDCVATEAISVAARRLHEKNLTAEVSALLDRLSDRVPQDTNLDIARRAAPVCGGVDIDALLCRRIEFQRCIDRACLP